MNKLNERRKNATPPILRIFRPMGMTENDVINAYKPPGRLYATQYKDGDCVADCLISAAIGEGASQIFTAVGKAAIAEAKRRAIRTAVVRLGSKAIPGLGWISTGKSVVEFVVCTVDCPCIENKR